MLRTTAGLGPYLVICADCMLAMVYIAVLYAPISFSHLYHPLGLVCYFS